MSKATASRALGGLSVQGFRGAGPALTVRFDPRKKLVVFFGDNGAGKSSLVDAIDFGFSLGKGSLAEISSTEIADLASKTHEVPLEVRIEWEGGERVARLERKKPSLVLDSGAPPRVRVIRRARLFAMVAATPGKRYEEVFGSFIDVPGVTASERQLETALKEAKKRFDSASERLTDARRRIVEVWIAQGGERSRGGGAEVDQALAWVRTRPSALDLEQMADWARKVGAAVSRLCESRASLQALESRQEAVDLDRLSAVEATSTATAALSAGVAALDRLLAESSQVLGSWQEAACPLCAQPVDLAGLRQRVAQQVHDLRELEAAKNRLQSAERDRRDLGRQIEAVVAAAAVDSAGLKELYRAVPALLVDRVGVTVGRVVAGELEPELARGEVETAAAELARQHGALAADHRALKEHDDLEIEALEAEAVAERLAAIAIVVREERKAFIEGVLREVDTDVNRLYARIHPNERAALGGIRHHLDPKTRGSLLQKVGFAGNDEVTPQSCYSESHLLTLAICLWLALARRQIPESTVLVLDDIVATVDAPHTQRLAELIATEAQHFAQVILTTHSRRLLRYLRSGIAPTAGIDVRTVRWSLDRGIALVATPDERELLEADLQAGLPDAVAALTRARRLFEGLLRQLTALYRRPVPFGEPTEPTLGELLDAWPTKTAKCVQVVGQGSLDDLIAPVRGLSHVRNLLEAHINSSEGDEVPDSEVVAFCEAVALLARALLCGSCGQLPSRTKGSELVCSCGTLTISPCRL